MTPTEETPGESYQIARIKEAIAALETQRGNLDEAIVDASITALKSQLSQLLTAEGEVDQQRKLATILFTDIVGHTKLVQDLDPEENMAIIDGALVRLARVIETNGGHVARYQGDGFKAVFGLPKADEVDPRNAVRAGLRLIAEAAAYGRELEAERGLQGFNVRVGIDTGLIVAGGKTEAEDTIKGLVVNLAARLESAAPPGGVLISHHTYQHIRGFFEVENLPPVKAKGFPYPVPVYLVVGAKPRRFQQTGRGVEGVSTTMVGRAQEFRMMKAAFRSAVAQREATLITIIGEAGVGKSRLLLEFGRWLEEQVEDLVFLRGRAAQQARGSSQFLWRDALGGHFHILDSDPLETVREKFTAGAAAALGVDGAMKSHLLGSWLGYDYSDSPYVDSLKGDADQLKRQARLHLGELLARTAAHQPLVIMLEDIHWADEGSLETVLEMMRHNSRLPMLVLCLARPSHERHHPAWAGDIDSHLQLHLEPLGKDDTGDLVRQILRLMKPQPADLVALISGRAEGNPFYAEELVKMLIDEGVIVTGADKWLLVTDRWQGTEVPPTLTGVLQARIDRLKPLEKQALQQASVIGRIFWDRALEALPNEGERALPVLQNKEFIFAQATSAFAHAVAYIFKHALLRDVTYESVLLRLRRDYHARIARWLEENGRDRLDEFAGIIADHYSNGDVADKAAAYWERAGDAATRTGNYRGAHDAFLQAIEHGSALEPLPLAQLYGKLAATLPILEDPHGAEKAYRQALKLLEQQAPANEETRWQSSRLTLMLGLVDTFYWQNRPEDMAGYRQPLEALLEAVGSLKQKADYYERASQTAFLQNRSLLPPDQMYLVEKSLRLAEESGDEPLIARKQFHLGFHRMWLRRLDDADDLLHLAWSGARSAGDAWLDIQCQAYLSVLYRLRSDSHALVAHLPGFMEAAEEMGFANYLGVAQSAVAWLRYRRGDWEEATAAAEAALGHWANGTYPVQWLALSILCAIALEEGRTAAAVEAARAMLDQQQQQLPQRIESGLEEGLAAWEAGEERKAAESLADAVTTAEKMGYL